MANATSGDFPAWSSFLIWAETMELVNFYRIPNFNLMVLQDAQHQSMMDQVEQYLHLALRAKEQVQTPLADEKLQRLAPDYFDLATSKNKFDKVRRILIIGRLSELKASDSNDPEERQRMLRKALQLYNSGCHAGDLFDSVYDYDHSDCASLFFSAARVCISFEQNAFRSRRGQLIGLGRYLFNPILTETNWKSQALQFLEQGRARALLHYVGQHHATIPTEVKNVLTELLAAVKGVHSNMRKRKRDSFSIAFDSIVDAPILNGIHPEGQTPLSTIACQALHGSIGAPEHQLHDQQIPISSREVFSEKQAAGMDLDDSSPSAVSEPEDSFASQCHASSSRAWRRWRKAFHHAKAQLDTIFLDAAEAALPKSGSVNDFKKFRRYLPEETGVIEYGLPSSFPTGLITLVIGNCGVSKASWEETVNAQELQSNISMLLTLMMSEHSTPPTPTGGIEPISTKQVFHQTKNYLTKVLVDPIRDHVDQFRRLIIVPCGDLAHVPWSLLFPSQLLSLAPSLSILIRLHEQHARIIEQPTTCVVAKGPSSSSSIQYSGIEALHIARLHKQWLILSDVHYTWLTLGQLVASSDLLHVCAHGKFDDITPFHSGIDLFQDPITLTQWHKLRMKTKLTIFSSCVSSFSKTYDSGSAFGFASTLLACGTQAFVGSLWDVDDRRPYCS